MGISRGYSLPMRVLHWLMAFGMITMIIAGIFMSADFLWGGQFPAIRGQLFDFHRGMGFVLFVLVIFRFILEKVSTPPSPLPSTIPLWQQKAAHFTHALLYLSLFFNPLFGWYATNLWGVKNISVFGLFNLPQLVEKNRELGNQLLEWHGYLGFFITALIILHISAALQHHFIKKDGLLLRMLKS